MTYLVIAFRWGWTNAHQYVVYAGPDESKALALAQAECDDRAGKYGVAVYKANADGTEFKRVAYFNSVYQEESPHHNWRLDMLKTLGHRMEHFVSGKVLLSNNDGSNTLSFQDVGEPPQWVVDLMAKEKERCGLLVKLSQNKGD